MSDAARGFPAFPAATRRAGRFARSWWGRAWVKALEDTALDEGQLRQGRRYARAGYVGAITVAAGRLSAAVQDYEDDTAYHTVVRLEPLSDGEWARFLEQIGAEAGHIAALLDGDMPTSLVDAAADAGVRLLPGIGDLDPDCPCPGFELPCRHAAALAYQTSWLLDADPFVLLLIRGRDQPTLLDALRATPDPAETGTGTPAAEAFARPPVRLPEPPPLPETAPGTLSIPPAPGIDPAALALLAADAAARARQLLGAALAPDGSDDPDLSTLDTWPDTVRWAATHPGAADRLAATPGIARATAAWRAAGPSGLDVLDTAWTPDPADLAPARDALAATWDEDPAATVWCNRWTAGPHQLRYARDGRWHPYRVVDGTWWPAGPPHRDAAAALLSLLA
ncbi:SWIM zinc finger family protein [Actinokineospora spheciospongiae]|uniref:SWIM zinc finger family protein n=1 Tax=Actinokineospora spheciospongiae TaxID=909613 RepID=UPI000D70D9FA|nr:SWIM zinc finger family protein [Actinokineospora spheciospongiae]PWW56861.1 putative Zn finger protein [Actinokineospora spheciospongiae]